MSSPDPAKKLGALLKKLRAGTESAGAIAPAPGLPAECDPIVHELVYSMLLWEAASGQARAAHKRLTEGFCDYNEARVALDEDVVHVLGDKYPLVHERAARLRAALKDIFLQYHALSLESLRTANKREAKQSLEQLDGVPSFAAARVLLVCVQGHAVPVDERLRDLLAANQIIEPGMTPEAAAAWLERQIPAEELPQVVAALQAWSDEEGTTTKPERRTQPQSGAAAATAKDTKAAKAGGKTAKAKARTRAGS